MYNQYKLPVRLSIDLSWFPKKVVHNTFIFLLEHLLYIYTRKRPHKKELMQENTHENTHLNKKASTKKKKLSKTKRAGKKVVKK